LGIVFEKSKLKSWGEKIQDKYIAVMAIVTADMAIITHGVATGLRTTDASKGYGKLEGWTPQ